MPFFLEHGREARLPIDLIAGNPNGESQQLDLYTSKMSHRFNRAFQIVAEKQRSYILRQQELYRERDQQIKVDDLVWLYGDILVLGN